MISQRTSGLNTVLTVCQSLFAAALFWIELVIVLIVSGKGIASWFAYAMYCAVLLVGLLLEALSSKRAKIGAVRREFIDAHRASSRQTVASTGLWFLYVVVTKDASLSRQFAACFVPSLYLMLFVTNRYFPRLLGHWFFGNERSERTLLVGRVVKIESLRPWLQRKANVGFRTVGILCDEDLWELEKCSYPRLGGTHHLAEIVEKYRITQVIRTELPSTSHELHHFVEMCDHLRVRLLMVANLPERWGRPLTFIDDDGVRFVGLRAEALDNPFNRLIKRTIDLVVSFPVVLFVLPITNLIVAWFQRKQSPGPLFFRQKRAGLQNREFIILKYRTMTVGHGLEAKQATSGDSRVYQAGRWFRKLSIDELPQFWNVFKGEMSVVGPRPHLVEHNSLFSRQLANYQVRTFVKPGITGLAQVRGLRGEARNMEDIARRVAADIEYLENWRPALEISIIIGTFLQMVRPPKTAY